MAVVASCTQCGAGGLPDRTYLYVEGTNSIDNNGADLPHHAQDGSGGIHVVWRSLHGVRGLERERDLVDPGRPY